MTRSPWINLLGRAALLCFVFGSNVHAQAVNPENQTMQFSHTTNGAADGSFNKYGNNEISVSGDMLWVQIGDSDNDRSINGVGIYEMKLLNQSLEDAEKLAELLCSPKDPSSDIPSTNLYTTRCNGEMRSSYVRDFSRPVAVKISDLVDSLTDAGVQYGRKVVKLDLSLDSIDREKDGFLVSFRFVNGGDYPIKFQTPDKWNTQKGWNMDILAVNGYRVGGTGNDDDQLGLALAGKLLVNSKQFSDEEINLAPHSYVVLKMKTHRITKFSAGTYDLNMSAFMNMEVTGIHSNLLRVDFHSDYKNPTRITFDRDYPSTPKEREQWEAEHRADMSFQPVKPGQTFAEDGLYRAVRTSGGYRSLQLRPFKSGDIATTDDVKMYMESASGTEFHGPVQWVWEGSVPTPVKQWSPHTMEGTEHFCEAGVSCPRSGRWLARIRTGRLAADEAYRYDLSRIVTLRRGDAMPAGDEKTDWEWLGA
jgi:hypothetical protein